MLQCEWCHLPKESMQWLLMDHNYWSVYLADEQDYIGRCILILKRHCTSLSELSMPEWIDLKELVTQVERCCKVVLGAELCNWSCLMNNFYKKESPLPHLHLHVRPRYEKTVTINGVDYVDSEFGHHYALKKHNQLSDRDRLSLYNLMKRHLETNTV